MSRTAEDTLAFAEQFIALLDEGRFNATYKFAVLLALMDLCMELTASDGQAPTSVTTRQLAEKVIELYWPHTVAFPGSTPGAKGVVLSQNRPAAGRGANQALIVSHIQTFRASAAPDPSATLTRSQRHAPKAYEKLVRQVEWSLVEMPLPRLQRFGKQEVPFIYVIKWDDKIKKSEFNDRSSFDNAIRLVGDAGQHLVRLAGLLRPLIQREWARLVATCNSQLIPQSDLEDFLFGRDRVSLEPVRSDLYDLQDGRCFYTGARLQKGFEIDHFFPWARVPNNGLENLVLANRSVNHNKRDHLVGPELLARWRTRSEEEAASLDDIAERRLWPRHPARSLSIVRSVYLRIPEGTRLWTGKDAFEGASQEALGRVLTL